MRRLVALSRSGRKRYMDFPDPPGLLDSKSKEKGEGFDKILKEEIDKDGRGKKLREQDQKVH